LVGELSSVVTGLFHPQELQNNLLKIITFCHALELQAFIYVFTYETRLSLFSAATLLIYYWWKLVWQKWSRKFFLKSTEYDIKSKNNPEVGAA